MRTTPLTVGASEAAKMLGISRGQVYELARTRALEAGRLTPGGRLRFSTAAIEALAASLNGAYEPDPLPTRARR